MTFRFTEVWAHVTIGLGMAVMIVGLGGAFAAAFVPANWLLLQQSVGNAERVIVGVLAVVAGVLIGGPLIAVGQLILAGLDVRRNLERLVERFVREDDLLCPACAEPVGAAANICGHCRTDLRRPVTAADRLLTPR
jgi:hypothetical protein